jgi:hypothetical protein
LNEFKYINTYLCAKEVGQPCDHFNLRDHYANTDFSVGNYHSDLDNLTQHNGVDCNNQQNPTSPFCIVRNQLTTELDRVASIRNLNRNLSDFFTEQQINDGLQLDVTYTSLQNAVQAPPSNPTVSIIENVISSALSLGAGLPNVSVAAKAVLGVLGGAFKFGTELANDGQGNSKTFQYSTTVANVKQDAIDGFNNQLLTLGTLFDFIYQDWGRVNALGSAIAGATAGSQWFWNGGTTNGQLLDALKPASKRSFYQSLLAARYEIGYFEAATVYDYTTYNAATFIPKRHPFYLYDQYPLDPTGPTVVMQTVPLGGVPQFPEYKAWLAIGDPGADPLADNYIAPGPDIMNHLFALPSTDANSGGLGVYRPEFFNAWMFPHIKCAPSWRYDHSDRPYGEGCPWGSGTVGTPLVTPGSLAATAKLAFERGNKALVSLTFVNAGDSELKNIVLKDVHVEVVHGHGKAQILAHLPLHIGNLAAGASAAIHLWLEANPQDRELELIEDGTLQDAQDTASDFTLTQVVHP